jgi:hypothetical protein
MILSGTTVIIHEPPLHLFQKKIYLALIHNIKIIVDYSFILFIQFNVVITLTIHIHSLQYKKFN